MTAAPDGAAIGAETLPRFPAGSGDTRPGTGGAVRIWLARLELVLTVGAALYAAFFWLRLPGQLPTEADYQALQQVLARELKPGDGAAVLPFWADRAKLFLHGLPVLGLPELDREQDVERFARLWVVSQPHLPRSDAAASLGALARKLTVVGEVRRFGPLELWLFTPKEGRAASYDFLAHVAEAQVQGAAPRPLWREFDYLPRHCLVLQGRTALHFPAATVTHGLRLAAGSLAPGGQGQIALAIDGQPLPPLALGPAGPSWVEQELLPSALGPADSFGAHQVDVAAAGPALCFDLQAF